MTNTRPMPENSTDEDYIRELEIRFPNPGPFLASVIKRYVELTNYAQTMEGELDSCSPSGKKSCPQCGTGVIINATKEEN